MWLYPGNDRGGGELPWKSPGSKMLSHGGGSAGGRILQDGDSGWQKSFLMLPGPQHGVSTGSCGMFDSAAGALGSSSPVPLQSGCVLGRAGRGEGGNSPHPGQHRSHPAASTQSDLFPLPSLAPSLANAICVAHCIAHARQMTGTKKDGDVFIPHSPSRSWGRRQVLWAAPGLEPLWLLPSSGRVS